jgi:hypothetical protein
VYRNYILIFIARDFSPAGCLSPGVVRKAKYCGFVINFSPNIAEGEFTFASAQAIISLISFE